jgi:septal ring factor EnvC (AmiA/AmiB activator)
MKLVGKIAELSTEIGVLKNNLQGAFKSTKDELDMHLDSINQNTNEIQAAHEYAAELEGKIEKLTEKMDEMQMQLNPHLYSNFESVKLSKREQELFMHLYMVEDRVSVIDLARRTGLTLEMCQNFLGSLMSKGVPLIRQIVNSEMLVSLEYTFKDLQARKNLLKIDATVSQMLG